MGGRGASSMGGGGKGKIPARVKITGAKSYNELKEIMQSQYGVTLGRGTSATDLEELKVTANNVIDIANDFGVKPGDLVTTIEAARGGGWYAKASYDGRIILNNRYFGDKAAMYKQYEKDLSAGFHPKGTTPANISDHELGHRLEALIVKKHSTNRIEEVNFWNKGTYSKKIIDNAVGKLYTKVDKKTINMTKAQYKRDLVGKLSGYALKSSLETLAEAVADFRANGTNANPLSIEIYNGIKEYLK